jgi:phosphoglycolate phosphatase
MSFLSSIKLFVTDWSGVISDDRPPVYETNMRMFEKHRLPRISFAEWLAATVANPVDYFKNQGFVESPEEIMAFYRTSFAEVRRDGIRPAAYPDARRFLEWLYEQGTPAWVVSSHPEEFVRSEADFYGFLPYVAGIIGSTLDKGERLSRLVRERDVSFEEALYVGDMKFDIRAAKSAGIRSVGISTGYDTHDELSAEQPDILVDSLTELMERFYEEKAR